jgi:nucleotide-binding universal stress UspA family protein
MFNRILVTMDNFEAVSPSTFETAMALAKQNHARLMLLQVLPADASPEADEMDSLQSLHKTAKTEGLASDVAQLSGEHDHVVCDVAHRWGADLIVLGQHETPASASEDDCAPPSWFAEQSPCSVLLAQQPDSLHLKASQVEQFAMMA